MIERIISIRHLGRFTNYQARGDVAMRKLTLIYGENGRGKTTLCAMFRSLMTGHIPPLQARKTIGQVDQPEVDIIESGQTQRLRNDRWTTTLPEIAIFDADFVHQNIYSGDYVERDHRRNSYRIIIGEQGVQLAQRIDQLDTDVRDANGNIRQLQEQVGQHIEGNTSVEDFIQIVQIEGIDTQIQTKEEEIQAIERRTQQANQIRSKEQLQTLTAPSLPTGIEAILNSTVADVSEEAETRVKEHIHQYLDENGEMWLEVGTRYVSENKCPFCKQDLTNNEMISLFRAYFNEAYRQLKQDVSTLPDYITLVGNSNSIVVMTQLIANNIGLMIFWGQFMGIQLLDVPTEQLQEALTEAANTLAASIAAKNQAPLDAIPMPDRWQDLQDVVESGRQAIDDYNQRVREINLAIAELKQPQRLEDITVEHLNLHRLKLAKKRYDPEVIADCNALTNEKNRKQLLEDEKTATKAELDNFCQAVLQTHQEEINRYLIQFNTSFRITNTRHQYVGGTPSSQFQIEIGNNSIELGDERTPENIPCFKTALSAGDRSALALAFFIAILRRDPNLANRVIILDDPFSSQDRFRRAATQHIIARLAEECNQVIVLSHDPHFLKALERATNATGIARLQISAVGESVEISQCNLDEIIECPLATDRARISAYVSQGQGTPIDVARAIRPVLEGYLRQAVPGAFNGMHTLGEMINAIRTAAMGDGIYRFTQYVEQLEQINSYARLFHHPPETNGQTPQIDSEELKGFARRALQFIGGG